MLFSDKDALQDLHAVIETPEGFRTFARIIMSFGYGSYVAGTPESAALHNAGVNLMDSIADADMPAYIRLCEAINKLERNTQEAPLNAR